MESIVEGGFVKEERLAHLMQQGNELVPIAVSSINTSGKGESGKPQA